jgi:glycosyltransferase involved in cell wall biosynthesis
MSPRVILDIAFLGHAHQAKSARRGAQRVAGQLFQGLLASQQCELSYVATSQLAHAYDFLIAEGISPASKLRCQPAQLRLSRIGQRLTKIVHQSLENRSLPARAFRRGLAEIASRCNSGDFRLSSALLENADIYHSPHTPYPEAVRRHPRLKKFLTLHDFIPLKNPDYFPLHTQRLMDGVLACLTPDNFAFCVSEATRNDALNFSSIPPEHLFVTPLAADERFFYPVQDAAQIAEIHRRYQIPEGPYFLALSAQDKHKNFPHLIRCFGALIESGDLKDAHLVIVGANPSRNREVAETLEKFPRARSKIVLPGFVPDEDLAAIYSGARAFLFPSFAEGFGIPPLEAMQCGTPVIASNTTSIPEVVGDAGILLPPTDESAWCQAILDLDRNESLRGVLRQKSLERCKLFSWQRFIDETLRGYRFSLVFG